MAFYTSGLKTHIIDPVHDSKNFQTEFRFKQNTAFLTNLRLVNVGITSSVAGVQQPYNMLTGAAACIQSIHLYDGNQLLDQILEFPLWAAWSIYNQSNQINEDMNQKLNKSNLGWVFSAAGQTTPSINAAYGAANENVTDVEKGDQQTPKAWLSLKGILPMLDNSVYLPTGVYKNLRLVIQYNKNIEQISSNNPDATDEFVTCEPTLVADEITDPKRQSSINSQYNGVRFLALEHDRLYVESIDATASGNDNVLVPKSYNFTPGGFDNKTINRLLIINSMSQTNDAYSLYSTLGSVSQLAQKIQVRINGANLFPKNGVTRPNERLAYLTDAWGTCNSNVFTNIINFTNTDQTGAATNTDNNYLGALDYFGCVINDKVLEMQIDYERSRDNAAPKAPANAERSTQLLYLNLFAEAQKQITVKGGKVTVSYL